MIWVCTEYIMCHECGKTLYRYLLNGVMMIVTSFDSSSSSKVQYCIEISSLKKKLYPLHRDSMSDMIRSGSASVYNFVEFTEVTDPPYSAILLWCNEGGRAPFASACRRQWSNPKIFTNSHSTFPHFLWVCENAEKAFPRLFHPFTNSRNFAPLLQKFQYKKLPRRN
jgi:hypothetical protein